MNIQVYFTELSAQVPEDTYERLFRSFPPELSEKINSYTDAHERKLRITGKGLLVYALKQFGVYPDVSLKQYGYTAARQPLLKGSDVQFSISHSSNLVVCAAARGAIRIGVDTERLKPVRLDLMRFYFDARSWQAIMASPDTSAAFYRHWTMREAAIKASGMGLRDMELADIVTDEDLAIQLHDETYYGHMLPIHYDYTVCLATDREPSGITHTAMPLDALL